LCRTNTLAYLCPPGNGEEKNFYGILNLRFIS
jgi:hypothetical protein